MVAIAVLFVPAVCVVAVTAGPITPVDTLALSNVKLPILAELPPRLTVVLPKVTLPANAPAAALIHAVPLEVNTFAFVPGAIEINDPVPFPINTLLAGSVVNPVPPCAAVIGVETLLTVTFAKVTLPILAAEPPSATVVLPMVNELLLKKLFGNVVEILEIVALINVKFPTLVIVPPSATLVFPIVTLEFAKKLLGSGVAKLVIVTLVSVVLLITPPVIVAFPVVTLVTLILEMVTLPLVILTLARVKPVMVVTVCPRKAVDCPSVIGVAKFESNCAKGIDCDAVENV